MPRTPNTRLHQLLQATGWSQAQLAHAVRTVAAEHGQQLRCDHSTISRWLAGAQPRPPAPAFLLEALARRLGRPVTSRDAGLTHAPVLVPEPPREAHPLRTLAELTAAELDPVRRRLQGTEVFSLAALAIPAPAQLPPPARPRPAAPPSGGCARHLFRVADAEHMQTMTTLFFGAAEHHGGAGLRAALAAYLAHDVTRWLHASAPDTVHRQLLSRAAQLTILLGTMCADDGDDAAAQRYHRTAAQLAAVARDKAILAIALRTMSAHAHDLGHHGPAIVNLAEQAAHQAAGAPPAVRAYTQAHLAVVKAHDNRHAALTALAHAEHFHGQADPAPDPFTAYPTGALHYQRAQTLTTLGDHAAAAGALTTSLRLRTSKERRARLLTHARLAETHLRLGHLDAALPHWQTFLDHYPALHSAAAARRFTAMRGQLRPHRRNPAAATLLARAAALT